jgi:hypothetical protein
VSAGVGPNKITTGIRVEDGEQVPTFVSKNADGSYTAKISSLTNSTYVIIYNEASFTDTAGKWYSDIVTEMASRTIVNGKTATTFDGDGFITRAEYAAILVRALGIPEGGASSFSDVGSSDWYCGAVSAAVQYGIIKGYADGTFRPNANITREEAMAMLQRAAKVAEFTGTTGTLTPSRTPDAFPRGPGRRQRSASAADSSSATAGSSVRRTTSPAPRVPPSFSGFSRSRDWWTSEARPEFHRFPVQRNCRPFTRAQPVKGRWKRESAGPGQDRGFGRDRRGDREHPLIK